MRKLKLARIQRKRLQLHKIFRDAEQKYCKTQGDQMVLVTKEFGRHRYCATVDARFAMELARVWEKKRRVAGGGAKG